MIVAVPKTNDVRIDEVLHPRWIDWLEGTNGFEIIYVEVPYHDERAPRGDVKATYDRAIKIGGVGLYSYEIAGQRWVPDWLYNSNRIGVVGPPNWPVMALLVVLKMDISQHLFKSQNC